MVNRRDSLEGTGSSLERLEVRGRASWRAWLQANATRSSGIWLVTFKKQARPEYYLSYDDIVDEALCFGWIDSLPHSVDAQRSMRLVTPRKAGSSWSMVNQKRVASLIASGRMTHWGLGVINKAKEDGSWSRLDEVEALTVPNDLAAALAQNAKARANFDAFPRSVKRAILEWIQNAKKPETRSNRVQEVTRSAEKNVRANQYRQSNRKSNLAKGQSR